ncbi:MAG: isocitrate lyase/phosphoenolpyruvate mutase family protein [Dokdonella sp.]
MYETAFTLFAPQAMHLITTPQTAKAQHFRQMHDRSHVLLLPNAWDAGSARVFAGAGALAIATTSAGVAWSLGYADGEKTPLDEVLAATARIARAVELPVTADIESGYGATADTVADSVREFIASGIVGVNIEDGLHAPRALRSIEDGVTRIRAARAAADQAGIPIVINARIDTYMLEFGDSAQVRFDETVRRGHAYLAAGADCVYPIGLADGAILENLVRTLNVPINVAARPGLPDVAELERLGIARVSLATRLTTLAYSAADTAWRNVLANGRFDELQSTLTHPDMQRLFD